MDIFKNCGNCSHFEKVNIQKILCNKGHFVAVDKQKFFYNPKEKESDRNPFFLNKYVTLANAFECDDYDFVDYIIITLVEFEEPVERKTELYTGSRKRYGNIVIEIKNVTQPEKPDQRIVYENMSYASKTRQYFVKVKKFIDLMKDCYANII